MSITEQRPPITVPPRRSRSGWLPLLSGILLLLMFAGFAVKQHFSPDEAESVSDKEQVDKFQRVNLVEEPRKAGDHPDWPQWRGPNRDGVSPETGLLTSWPPSGPPLLWEKPIGEGYSSPVIAKGRLYVLCSESGQENVVCFDAADGREIWRYRYGADYHNSYGNGPRSTPAIDGDRIYTVGGTGVMHCLRTHPKTADGEVVWTRDLLTDFGARNIKWGTSFSPLVVGDLVCVQPGGPNGNSLAALDKLTGAVRWRALDDEAGYSSPLAVTIAGQPQIVFFTATALVGVTPDKGELLWRFPWVTNSMGCNIGSPIFLHDRLFISTGYGKGCALVNVEKTAAGFVPRQVYKNRKLRSQISSGVRHNESVYGFDENSLTCMNLRTGKVQWSEDFQQKGSVLIADGHLIALGELGLLALAEVDSTAYKEKARFQFYTGRPYCWTAPVIAGGRLYLRVPGKLTCLDLRAVKP